MQSNVEPFAESPRPDESEGGLDAETTSGGFGLDGSSVEPAGFSERLGRRLRRQARLYGSDSAREYLAKLIELEAGGEDFYDRAAGALGVSSEDLRRLIEGSER